MKLAFCLYKYFPYGGMQYNFMRIASECLSRGHAVRVYVHEWAGDIPEGFDVIVVPTNKKINYKRQKEFNTFVIDHLERHPVDVSVGFNMIPGVDVYYAADNCFAERQKSAKWVNWLPRYKFRLDSERALLESNVTILAIAEQQVSDYNRHYRINSRNVHLLPPGIRKDCLKNEANIAEGKKLREEHGIANDQYLLLSIGSGFKTKGLDRSIEAFSRLPEELRKRCFLLVIGRDNFSKFKRMADKFGVANNIQHIDGSNNIPAYLQAADLLLHPAYNEAAGMVLLEAGIAGLPLIASGSCGFAHYVEDYGFGVIIPEPFSLDAYVKEIAEVLNSADRREVMSRKGVHFADESDIFSRAEVAANIIESCAK